MPKKRPYKVQAAVDDADGLGDEFSNPLRLGGQASTFDVEGMSASTNDTASPGSDTPMNDGFRSMDGGEKKHHSHFHLTRHKKGHSHHHHHGHEPEPEPEEERAMAVSEDALADLSFAFVACDFDDSGTVEVPELFAILGVLGSSATEEDILVVMREAKEGFAKWCEEMGIKKQEEFLPGEFHYPVTAKGGHRHGDRDHHALSMEKKPASAGIVGKMQHSSFLKKLYIAQAAQVINIPFAATKKGLGKALHHTTEAAIKVSEQVAKSATQAIDASIAAGKQGVNVAKKGLDAATSALNLDMEGLEVEEDEVEVEERLDLYLDYPEFIFLMTSHLVDRVLPSGDWHETAYHMRMLRNAFDTADVDGDNQLEFEELEMVVLSLHPGHNMTHDDIVYLWSLINPDEKEFVAFFEFVKGMVAMNKDPRLEGKISLTEPNKWELLSLIMDAPVSQADTNKILESYTFLERLGIKMLNNMLVPMDKKETKRVIDRAVIGHLHWLSDVQRFKMKLVHSYCMFQAFAIGFLSSIATCSMENFLGYTLETDGAMDFYCVAGRPLDPVEGNAVSELCLSSGRQIGWFWLFNILALGVCVALEIGALMITSVQNAVRISWALDYRLIPLNQDRAFVADSLVRAAFEMGNPESPVFGVDPQRESTGSSRIRVAFMMLLYRAKIVLTGAILKVIVSSIWPRPIHVWVKPWMVLPATCLWDTLVASSIMEQAKIRGIGVSTCIEVFNEIMEEHFEKHGALSQAAVLQTARAIGVAIVKHGTMYPTMEMLLRHTIQYLELKGKPIVTTPGIIDNAEDFVAELATLPEHEQAAVLSVHLLCFALTGIMDHHEAEFYREVCSACTDQFMYMHHRVAYTCQRFRNFEPLTAEMLRGSFDDMIDVNIPRSYYLREGWDTFLSCLTC